MPAPVKTLKFILVCVWLISVILVAVVFYTLGSKRDIDNEILKHAEGYALFFTYLSRIEKDLYYSNCINIKGMMSIDTKNITFKVKY